MRVSKDVAIGAVCANGTCDRLRKQEMVLAVLAEISVPMADVTDIGSSRGDIRASVAAVATWLTEPPFPGSSPTWQPRPPARQNPPRPSRPPSATLDERWDERSRSAPQLAVHLPSGTDLEMAQDLMAALIYWRMVVRQAPVEPDYLDCGPCPHTPSPARAHHRWTRRPAPRD